MQTRNHPIALLSRSLLATTFILALGGFTAGSCFGPIDDPGDVIVEPPLACSFDSECGNGFFCDLDADAPGDLSLPATASGEPERCPQQTGLCRPLETCLENADCAVDEHCELDASGPPVDCLPACAEGEDCSCETDAILAGTCRPGPAECVIDADCPAGSFCPILPTDCGCATGDARGEPCSADCYFAPSFCEPREPESACETDADCGPGAICSFLEIVCPADPATGQPDCFQQIGVCIEAPVDTCQGDADCPNGYCETFATCAGLDCPQAPPSACVYPACDTGDEIFCDMVPPVCAAGETLAVQGGCWACLDARTCENAVCDGVTCAAGEHCEPESVVCVVEPCAPVPVCVTDPQPDVCFGAWTDQLGTCRGPTDGMLPAECCTGMCTTDAECGPGGSCWDGLCGPGPTTCPGESDPRVSYVCQGSECWVIGAWICPAEQEMFSNSCGSGCIDSGLCTGLDETTCRADALCEPLYGASACDPGGVCTTDMAFQGCERIF